MKYFIGWDVGAWHCRSAGSGSKDALAILDEDQSLIGLWEGRLSETILGVDNASQFLAKLFDLCKVEGSKQPAKDDTFWLSIDTPLGWPTLFRELLQPATAQYIKDHTRPVDMRKGKINNPFLHRQTEVAIGQSLSAVQDQIGSQSTKALHLLRVLSANRISVGRWATSTPAMTIIETYPAPCIRSLTFIDGVKSISGQRAVTSDDMLDALICAALAFELDTHPDTVASPWDGCDADEGWIFAPTQRLPQSHGISYGRLVGSQSPPKSLQELLSQVQVGLVLKAAMKKDDCADEWQLVENWLATPKESNDIFQSTTQESLRALFKLLNPKVKASKYPADALLQDTAQRISDAIASTCANP